MQQSNIAAKAVDREGSDEASFGIIEQAAWLDGQ